MESWGKPSRFGKNLKGWGRPLRAAPNWLFPKHQIDIGDWGIGGLVKRLESWKIRDLKIGRLED
ncbi:hypothetical protein MM236_12640 [Belliella sp. DSM 107340]|uniref:Uncharacterized protein n=1 Tax=Belliella calami TaxID=2923436 RepID=A0ABS9UQX7_9BACT|nr:hypothetical protein [Belliella calami]MCH7398844.1 hypothetical protein [Belliella calami]